MCMWARAGMCVYASACAFVCMHMCVFVVGQEGQVLAWFILFGFIDGDVTREGGKEGTREHLVMGARAMGLMEARVHGREASGSTTQGL